MAKGVAVESDIRSISMQLKAYENMNGFMPTTEQGLQALVAQPTTEPTPSRWIQLFDSMPKDPWHSNYIYKNPGLKNPGSYDLYSAGPDRMPETQDDDWGR
jgi:general secretion pathway protein G